MDLIMNGLLVAATIFAGSYCWMLSRRVAALKDLDSGLGGAITQMTRALEDARRALEDAKAASREGRQDLRDLTTRAEAASGQLRILLAATRDLSAAPATVVRPPAAPARSPVAAPAAARAATGPTAVADAPHAPEAEPRASREPEGAVPERVSRSTRPAVLIPKPRMVFPLETLRPRQAAGELVPQDEHALVAGLSALAGSAGA